MFRLKFKQARKFNIFGSLFQSTKFLHLAIYCYFCYVWRLFWNSSISQCENSRIFPSYIFLHEINYENWKRQKSSFWLFLRQCNEFWSICSIFQNWNFLKSVIRSLFQNDVESSAIWNKKYLVWKLQKFTLSKKFVK